MKVFWNHRQRGIQIIFQLLLLIFDLNIFWKLLKRATHIRYFAMLVNIPLSPTKLPHQVLNRLKPAWNNFVQILNASIKRKFLHLERKAFMGHPTDPKIYILMVDFTSYFFFLSSYYVTTARLKSNVIWLVFFRPPWNKSRVHSVYGYGAECFTLRLHQACYWGIVAWTEEGITTPWTCGGAPRERQVIRCSCIQSSVMYRHWEAIRLTESEVIYPVCVAFLEFRRWCVATVGYITGKYGREWMARTATNNDVNGAEKCQ